MIVEDLLDGNLRCMVNYCIRMNLMAPLYEKEPWKVTIETRTDPKYAWSSHAVVYESYEEEDARAVFYRIVEGKV